MNISEDTSVFISQVSPSIMYTTTDTTEDTTGGTTEGSSMSREAADLWMNYVSDEDPEIRQTFAENIRWMFRFVLCFKPVFQTVVGQFSKRNFNEQNNPNEISRTNPPRPRLRSKFNTLYFFFPVFRSSFFPFFDRYWSVLKSRGCQNSSGRPVWTSSDLFSSQSDHRRPKNEQNTDQVNEY